MAYRIKTLGELEKLDATFTNDAGSLFDPAIVKFTYKSPSGVVTKLTYGTDTEVVRKSIGDYFIIVDCNEPGFWFYRVWFTGNGGQGAAEGRFLVRPSQVVDEAEEDEESSGSSDSSSSTS